MVISPLMLIVVLIAYVVIQAQQHPSYPTWNPEYVSKPMILISCYFGLLSHPFISVVFTWSR